MSNVRIGLPYYAAGAMIGIILIWFHDKVFLILIVSFLILLFFFINWRIAGSTLLFLLMFAGYASLVIPVHSKLSPSTSSFSGKIGEAPHFDGNTARFPLKTDFGEKVMVTETFLTVKQKQKAERNQRLGFTCKINGILESPDPPGNFHDFSYTNWLHTQKIFMILKPTSLPLCYPQHLSFNDRLLNIRHSFLVRFQSDFPGIAGEMMAALTLGDQSEMDPSIIQDFRQLGLVHLLAISGLHLNLLFGFIYFMCIRIGISRERSMLMIIGLIPFYMALTGFSPSVLRAGIMMIIFYGSQLFQWRLSPLECLSIAVLFLLGINPLTVFALGFELSCLVTFAIIVSISWFKNKKPPIFVRLTMISLISQVVTMPLLIYHFYDLSLLAPLANLIFVPLISFVILPLSIFTFLINMVSPFFGHISYVILNIILAPSLYLLKLLSHFRLTIRYGELTAWSIFVMITGLIPILMIWEKARIRYAYVTLILFLILPYGLVRGWHLLNPFGYVAFLNVGQGDSTFIELPHSKMTMLIDTGGTIPIPHPRWEDKKVPYDVGIRVVYHELQAMGVNKLNYLVLTHKDYDHIGGAEGLLKYMKVDYLIINDHFQIQKRERDLFHLAEKKGTHILIIHHNFQQTISGFSFQFISVKGSHLSSNNGSLVVRTKLGGVTWLFTGDLEKEGENNLIQEGINLQANILKVGHHGSKTSTGSNWLQHVQPQLAIISVGKNNRYGHPNDEVIRRLNQSHIPILRTDQKGEIEFTFTKKRIISIKTVK